MNTTVPSGLHMLCDTLDGVEELRIDTQNRYRALTRSEADSDGEYRGLGLDDSHPIVATMGATLDALTEQENLTIKAVQKEVRLTPFGDWIKVQKGVGEKQAARLLAAVGDPYMRVTEEGAEPRTLRQLWAYSGLAVDGFEARKPKSGMSQDEFMTLGKAQARMRAYLVATSCIKTKGKFREVYDEGRKKYENAVHVVECKRCGPKGKPAQPGSPLSPGHQHARAIRKVSKAILKDMWIIAREYHKEQAELEAKNLVVA